MLGQCITMLHQFPLAFHTRELIEAQRLTLSGTLEGTSISFFIATHRQLLLNSQKLAETLELREQGLGVCQLVC